MENVLPDPFEDRVVKEILPPPNRPLPHKILFPKKDSPNWRELRSHFIREGRLSKADLIQLLTQFKKILQSEPNILKIDDPVTVVGDIHGQFYDLLKVLEIGGDPEKNKYLFLGDYVDRGSFSIECFVLLCSIKIRYKDTFLMLRGNHECRQITSHFNFKQECQIKYDLEIYEKFTEVFDCLPIACIINDKFLAIHGGISPEIGEIDQLNNIKRISEPPRKGPFCDLLWSDPVGKKEEALMVGWRRNTKRGCSYVFGAKAAIPFLEKNDILTIVRAHEAQLDGYMMYNWDENIKFPAVITVFSAPNYCDMYNNMAAVIKFKDNMVNIRQFKFQPHPFILPNFMNVINWSIPFISEKIYQMLIRILKVDPNFEDEEESGKSILDETITESLKMKVKFCIMLMKMYRTLREERELIMKLKGFCPGNKIPRGLLLEGVNALKSAVEKYEKCKELDAVNEGIPNTYK